MITSTHANFQARRPNLRDVGTRAHVPLRSIARLHAGWRGARGLCARRRSWATGELHLWCRWALLQPRTHTSLAESDALTASFPNHIKSIPLGIIHSFNVLISHPSYLSRELPTSGRWRSRQRAMLIRINSRWRHVWMTRNWKQVDRRGTGPTCFPMGRCPPLSATPFVLADLLSALHTPPSTLLTSGQSYFHSGRQRELSPLDDPQFQRLRRSGTTSNCSTTAGMIICRGGATLNFDSSSHHPFISTLYTKSFQPFTINFWAELSPLWTTSRASPSKRSAAAAAQQGGSNTPQQSWASLSTFLRQLPGGLLGPWSPSGVASALHCKHGVWLTAVPQGGRVPRPSATIRIRSDT
jgi:hypothetical protein